MKIRGYCVPDFSKLTEKERRFKDVPADAWYADAVEKCAELGLMNGVSDTCFGVGQKVTREQLAAVLIRLKEKMSDK